MRALRGWSYADVLPYFKRAEQHVAGRATPITAASGPLDVFAPDLKDSPLAAAFVQAAVEAGYGLSTDANGERQEGFGRIDRTTTRNGRRCKRRTHLSRARADRRRTSRC